RSASALIRPSPLAHHRGMKHRRRSRRFSTGACAARRALLTAPEARTKAPLPPMETVFSGIQPSGELHLGNYLGAVRTWVELQEKHRCFYCVVDYHAITQPYEPAQMPTRVREMAVDILACGIDPAKATLFVQSAVPEHT